MSEPPAEGLEVEAADAEDDIVLSDVPSLSFPRVGTDEDAVSEAVAVAVDVEVAVLDDVEDEDEAGGSSAGIALAEMPAASARTSLRAAAAPLWLE